jgi:hypothetical protein
MQPPENAFLLAVGLICLILAVAGAAYLLSPNLRERRKRRRNYGPVISRARRPIVTLSVNTRRA